MKTSEINRSFHSHFAALFFPSGVRIQRGSNRRWVFASAAAIAVSDVHFQFPVGDLLFQRHDVASQREKAFSSAQFAFPHVKLRFQPCNCIFQPGKRGIVLANDRSVPLCVPHPRLTGLQVLLLHTYRLTPITGRNASVPDGGLQISREQNMSVRE